MVTLLSIYLVTQYGKPAHEGDFPSRGGFPLKIFKRGTVPLKRVLFTLQHDLQEKEPKLQKATMIQAYSMKVQLTMCLLYLHAPIYRNSALTSALLHRVPKIQIKWHEMTNKHYKSYQEAVLESNLWCFQLFPPKKEEFNVKTSPRRSRLTLAYRTLLFDWYSVN